MDELEQACDQVTGESISTVMQREQWRLLERLAEAVRPRDQPDPIRAKLESLVQSAQAYLGVRWDEDKATEVTAAAPLARDLMLLRWELEDEQVTTDLEQAGAAMQVQVEQLAQKHGPMIRRTMTEPQVVDLLKREDDRLHQVLITLYRQLEAWVPFDDHATSERDGVLANHTKREQMLATALCDVMEVLEDVCTRTAADQLTDQILAELRAEQRAYKSHTRLRLRRLRSTIEEWQPALADNDRQQIRHIVVDLLLLCQHLGITGRPTLAKHDKDHLPVTMHSNLLHILDEVPVDEGSHRRLRSNLERLMHRMVYWRDYPDTACDGDHVADVLMPIITQLLKHEQTSTGGAA